MRVQMLLYCSNKFSSQNVINSVNVTIFMDKNDRTVVSQWKCTRRNKLMRKELVQVYHESIKISEILPNL